MVSGNGQVSIAVLTLLIVFAAAWAGRDPNIDLSPRFPALVCADAWQFERLGIEALDDEPALIPSASRLVAFDWQPETGELAFRTRPASPAITLPERFVKAASLARSPNCE